MRRGIGEFVLMSNSTAKPHDTGLTGVNSAIAACQEVSGDKPFHGSRRCRGQPTVPRAADSAEGSRRCRGRPTVPRTADSAEDGRQCRGQPTVPRAADGAEGSRQCRGQPTVPRAADGAEGSRRCRGRPMVQDRRTPMAPRSHSKESDDPQVTQKRARSAAARSGAGARMPGRARRTSGPAPPLATGSSNPPLATGSSNPPLATGSSNPPLATGRKNPPLPTGKKVSITKVSIASGLVSRHIRATPTGRARGEQRIASYVTRHH
jgi:hypothetical protein